MLDCTSKIKILWNTEYRFEFVILYTESKILIPPNTTCRLAEVYSYRVTLGACPQMKIDALGLILSRISSINSKLYILIYMQGWIKGVANQVKYYRSHMQRLQL